MTTTSKLDVIDVLVDRYGQTFASEAGIDVEQNTPSALFRLLCLSLLTSARISSSIAVSATKALADAGLTTPDAMVEVGWDSRTKVLNESGYARYDESTSTYLAETSELLIDGYAGDLRTLREHADGDLDTASDLLTEFTGIGRLGASIFLREVQVAWTEYDPCIDERTLDEAGALSLPTNAAGLRDLVDGPGDFATLVAALVRCGLEETHDDVSNLASER